MELKPIEQDSESRNIWADNEPLLLHEQLYPSPPLGTRWAFDEDTMLVATPHLMEYIPFRELPLDDDGHTWIRPGYLHETEQDFIAAKLGCDSGENELYSLGFQPYVVIVNYGPGPIPII